MLSMESLARLRRWVLAPPFALDMGEVVTVIDAYSRVMAVLADAEVYDTRIPASELRRALEGP
jgi:hypothetical protein